MGVDSTSGNNSADNSANTIDPVDQAASSSSSSAKAVNSGGTISGSTSFNSMDQLRKEEPELYKVIVEGLGVAMVQKMQRDQDRHHQLVKEYEQDS